MRGIVEKHRKYYKKVQASYQSGNAGGMYHYWDEYRAGARCAQIDTGRSLILQSVVMQIGGWTNEFHEGYVCNIIVDGSNDNTNWYRIKGWGDRRGCNTTHTLDCSENKTPYRYYRFYAENGGWAYNDALSVASVNYRGYYITNEEVVETDDYDFVTSIKTLKGLKKANIRKYYHGVIVPNCTDLGTVTVNDCVMSGFTTGTMAALPNTAKSLHNAEYMFKFTTGSDITAEQNVVHIDSTFELHIQSGNLGMWHHYNQAFTNTAIAANTTYWVKMLLNDKDYNYAISMDGETFTTWASGVDSGTDISMQNSLVVGNVTTGTRPFKGSIDFKACYAKSNGEFIWHGTKVDKGAEATADDYDIYEDVWRDYYKYVYEPWEQPVLTSNGIIGGDDFAVTALNTDSRTQPYYVFDTNFSDTFTAGWLSKASSNYFEWYNPNPINITQLKIQYQTTSASSVGYISKWDIKASNDGLNYVDIVSGGTTGNYGVTNIQLEHNNYYKYWRLYPITWSSEWYAIINMDIVAQERKGIISSFEDYDYYIDHPPKYYAFKTYEKGQYYGNQSNS